MLKQFGTDTEIAFLQTILKHSEDMHKIEAARAIKNFSEGAFMNIYSLVDETTKPRNIILEQVKMEVA